MANSEHSSEPERRRSTDYHGMGQSGYAAGRREDDPSLRRDVETQNLEYTRVIPGEEPDYELGTDERWVGRGGAEPGARAGS